LLEQNGYTSVAVIAEEEDTDRLAIKSGIGASKAQALKLAVAAFISTEWPSVEAKMLASIAAAEAKAAEVARQEAEAQAAEAATAEAAEAAAVADGEPDIESSIESTVSVETTQE
jgi:hypothetical protein